MKKHISIRIDEKLESKIRDIAIKENRSISNVIETSLNKTL